MKLTFIEIVKDYKKGLLNLVSEKKKEPGLLKENVIAAK